MRLNLISNVKFIIFSIYISFKNSDFFYYTKRNSVYPKPGKMNLLQFNKNENNECN